MHFLRIIEKPIPQVVKQHRYGFSRVHSCGEALSRKRKKGERHELRLQNESARWLLRRAAAVP
jgi:hypothetical protein